MKHSPWMRAALVIAASFVAAIAAASGGEEAAAIDALPEVRITFRALGAYQEGNAVEVAIEEAAGVNVIWDARAPGEYRQQTQTILASGDYPDAMEAHFADPEGVITELAEDEVIIALDDLLARHGPNILQARPLPEQWFRPFGDQAYSINSRHNPWAFEWGYTIRKDWLENLGLSVPQDLDEYREVVRAFTMDDPDGDGQQDTFGFSGGWPTQGRRSMIEYILTGFDVLISHWQEVDGELVWWAVNPGTKEAIRYFRELYQNGYVDQEFPIMTRPEWLDKQRQDKYGTMWWWNTHLDEGYSAWWTEFKRAVPHGEVDFIPPAAGPDGRREMPGQGVIGERRAAHILFAGGKHPDKIIQVLDYLASDEGADVAAFGIPGVHWERGENKVTSFIDTAEDQAAAGNYIFSWFFRKSNMMVTSPLVLENRNAYIDYVVRPIIEQRVPAEGEFRAGLSGLEESRLLRMQIESDIDLDAEWDDYVKEWHDSGGQQIVDEKTAVWKESM